MKTIRFFIFLGLMSVYMAILGQDEIREVKILTNMHCQNCKKKIENELAYTKGVVETIADLETKIVTVKYHSQQTSPEKLVEAIQKLGYQATDLTQTDQNNDLKTSEPSQKENCRKKSSCCKKKQEECKH
ncbi:MAG: heavy-metal-associated domain-containing protein [Bacteroidales bacterium]|nr:heavy-metal-associated domain-containing protein [Bacteroidales bacterium]